ncbi:hypothetical protein HYH02_009405 [Chlamydomonas schloesseri]|uniref:Fe2OG dioxygenase domain-containing protein n=1 Tax=Chlamydomonas schloesseri TaxID=2026947 RepID=A0A835TFV2_9CHLO|nr:hypothetical protein HYH02_009405 [Chlamydomonas schloesseri]|eukprot:KAG2443341.1 hypothetical protein HYH02_009405 [Chlamydomonas schloesseri]
MHVTLDACIVPDVNGAARVDTAHVVVLDNFISEAERSELLDFITEPGWDHTRGPPSGKWQRSTRDRTDAAPTWGLTGPWLQRLAAEQLRARLEVQSRLAALYPDYNIAHMPSEDIQVQAVMPAGAGLPEGADGDADGDGMYALEEEARGVAGSMPMDEPPEPVGVNQEQQAVDGNDRARHSAGSAEAAEDGEEAEEQVAGMRAGCAFVDCNQYVANAAVHGDSYSWHVDADPSTLPYPSPWTLEYGQYVNREPGRPLFVSLLLYLNPTWERGWDAETLFLDTPSDCGVLVRPKPYRAVLLDQDVLHRLSPPSAAAGGRPRYSLVWKLVFLPRRPGQRVSLARRDWGRPAPFGSAALLEHVVAGLQGGGGGGGSSSKGPGTVGAGGRLSGGQAQTGQHNKVDEGAAATAADVPEACGGPAAGAPGGVPGPHQQQHQQQQAAAAHTGAGQATGTCAEVAAAPKPLSAAAKKRKRRTEAARRKKLKLEEGGGAGEAHVAGKGAPATGAADEDSNSSEGPIGMEAAAGGEVTTSTGTAAIAERKGGGPPQPAAGKGVPGPVAPPGQGKRKGKRGGLRAKQKKELADARAAAAQRPVPIGPWNSRWGPPPRPAVPLLAQAQPTVQQPQSQPPAQAQPHVAVEDMGHAGERTGATSPATSSAHGMKGLQPRSSEGGDVAVTKRKTTRGGARQRKKKAAAVMAAAPGASVPEAGAIYVHPAAQTPAPGGG